MIRFKSKKSTFVLKRGGQKINKGSGSDPEIAISEFESPKKNQNSDASTDSIESVTRKRPREKKTLVKQIKQTMAIYESSVKSLSTYGCKNATNDSSLLMRLIILKCLYENFVTLTLSLELDSNQYKWVIFKPRKPGGVLPVPGTCIKLFHPWQQILVPSLKDYVIICTDFYSQCNLTDIGASEDMVKEEVNSLQVNAKWKSFNAVPLTKLLSNMVPYTVRNPKTISKQLSFYKPFIDVDVVVCQIWKTPESIFGIIKDSDKFISALEVGIEDENEELCNVLSVGTFLSFSNLSISEKVTTWSYMPLFSVISLYGSRQNHCYKLGVRPNTTWNVEMLLDIPFRQKEPPRKTLKEVSMMGSEDCRFNMQASIKYLNRNQLVIWDDSTNLKGKVEIIPAFKNQFLTFTDQMELNYVDLKYVRYFRGKLSMDKFSSMQFSDDLPGELLDSLNSQLL